MATRSKSKPRPSAKSGDRVGSLIRKPTSAAALECAALFDTALAHHRAGRTAEADALYQRILAIDPQHSDSLHLSGMAAQASGDTEKAIRLIGQAVELKPKASLYLGNLGNVLRASGRVDEAIERYRKAIALEPKNALPQCNLGNALADKGQLEEALLQYEKALALRPDFYEALFNLALTQRSLERLEEATATLRRATALHPNNPEAHYTLAQLLLLQGNLADGWREYDWRWKLGEYAWLRDIHGEFVQARWQGESLAGKTLLVYAEQGMGDSLHFVRYLPALAEQAGKLIFAVHPRLKRLMGQIRGVQLVTLDTVPLPAFDLHSPLLSLPQFLGTLSVDDIPASPPYLAAEEERAASWRARLAAIPGFKVGIAWQGNPNAKIDKGRSPPLAAFAPLAEVPGVRLISLQQIDGLEQLVNLPPGMVVEQLGADIDRDGAFVDTAAIMECLDLVVVSDSAIAHLAGALGRPVWIPLKKVPDWRFLLGREDSPWYPSMRLFRQSVDGDWSQPFQRIASAIRDTLGIGAVAPPPALPGASAPTTPFVPQSWGEMIDKITILEIKTEKIADPAKLGNIRRELDQLVTVREQHFPRHQALALLAAKLKQVNESLWWIEDDIRECERAKDFGPKFIELARAVYVTNDQRAVVKREINDLLGSALIEEKSYAAYTDDLGQASAALVDNLRKSEPATPAKAQTLAALPASSKPQPAAASVQSAYQSGIIISSTQGVFAFDLEDQFVGRSLRETGSYGTTEIELASRLISKTDQVLVVGAHIGTVAIGLARKCEHVTAFEANPTTYKFLQCNLILNGLGNIDAHNLAAGDKSERLRFVLNRHNSGGSKRYPVHADPMYFYDNPEVTEVEAVALDGFLASRDYALIFMDIEGSEYFALQGMRRLLERSRALFVEFIPHHLRNVAAVTPEAFSALLEPHFEVLFVPGLNAYVDRENFGAMLRRMYDINMAQEQIVFLKRGSLAALQRVPGQ